ENALLEAVASDHQLVRESAQYLLRAGGKRFRPLLVLLGSRFGDPTDERLVPGAVAVELTHLATLYHDDVIDEAAFRRGIPSANSRFDNTIAILTGDFLFARASGIAADLGTATSRLFAETIAKVCDGQIRERAILGRADVTPDAYLDVIRLKTGALIATASRLGGLLSEAADDVIEGLARLGEALGLAFQLSDDIMDLVSDEATLGKKPGADLAEGVYTLPVIVALHDDGDGRGAELRELLEAGPPDGERLARALELVRSDGTLDQAREAVGREVRRAISEVEQLPAGTPADALVHVATYIAGRCGATT
ncbi:MAG: polyprenyl synthetase family protein, partial [Gaiellaceae bacterium]